MGRGIVDRGSLAGSLECLFVRADLNLTHYQPFGENEIIVDPVSASSYYRPLVACEAQTLGRRQRGLGHRCQLAQHPVLVRVAVVSLRARVREDPPAAAVDRDRPPFCGEQLTPDVPLPIGRGRRLETDGHLPQPRGRGGTGVGGKPPL